MSVWVWAAVCVLHCMSKSDSLISFAVCSKVAVNIYVSVLLLPLPPLLVLLLLPCLSAFISFLIHLWIRQRMYVHRHIDRYVWSLHYVLSLCVDVCECARERVRAYMNDCWWKNKQKFVFTPVTYFRAVTVTIIPIFFPLPLLLLLLLWLLRQPRLPSLLAIIIMILDVCCFILAVILWFRLILKAIHPNRNLRIPKMRAKHNTPHTTSKFRTMKNSEITKRANNNNNKTMFFWIFRLFEEHEIEASNSNIQITSTGKR